MRASRLDRCSNGGLFVILAGLLFHLQHSALNGDPFSLGLALDKVKPTDEDRQVGSGGGHELLRDGEGVSFPKDVHSTLHTKKSTDLSALAIFSYGFFVHGGEFCRDVGSRFFWVDALLLDSPAEGNMGVTAKLLD